MPVDACMSGFRTNRSPFQNNGAVICANYSSPALTCRDARRIRVHPPSSGGSYTPPLGSGRPRVPLHGIFVQSGLDGNIQGCIAEVRAVMLAGVGYPERLLPHVGSVEEWAGRAIGPIARRVRAAVFRRSEWI